MTENKLPFRNAPYEIRVTTIWDQYADEPMIERQCVRVSRVTPTLRINKKRGRTRWFWYTSPPSFLFGDVHRPSGAVTFEDAQ